MNILELRGIEKEQIGIDDLMFVLQNSPAAKEDLENITSIEQSAKMLWYFNTNHIKRMKIKKGELNPEPSTIVDVKDPVLNCLWPLDYFVFERDHNVYLVNKVDPTFKLIADWNLY